MNNNKVTVFEVNLTSKDLIRFNFSVLLAGRNFYFIIIISVVMLAILLESIIQSGFSSVPKFPIIYLLVLFFVIYSTYRSAIKAYKNKFIQETKRYELSVEGIKITSESTISNILWKDVTRVLDTKVAVYVFISNTAAYILPRRCLSAEQISMLLSHTMDKVQIRKKWFRVAIVATIVWVLLILLITSILILAR